MSRSRQAATTLARSTPGADGIAITTSSGPSRSRISVDLPGRAKDLHAGCGHVALAGVVVDEADRPDPEVGIQLELANDHLAAGARPDDEHATRPGAARGLVRTLRDRAPDEARAAHQQDGEQQVEDDDRARKVVVVRLRQREDRDEDHARHHRRPHDRPHVGELEIAPPLAVEAQDLEHDRLADRDEGDRPCEHRHVPMRDPNRHVQEPQHERESERRRSEHRVGRELLGAALEHRVP